MRTTGIHYLHNALAREDALAIADRIWWAYSNHGVKRDDPATWPGNGFQVKLKRVVKRSMFSAFGSDIVKAAIAEVLGDDWYELDPWGGALISFPSLGPWELPKQSWHSDLPPRGSPDAPAALRMFGFVNDVAPQGGGTLVIEGSHELIRRMVAESPNHDVGRSADIKRRLRHLHPWFKEPTLEPIEIDGITLRVAELTGEAGDVVFMLPWTLHNMNMNCADQPRFMVTHTVFAKGAHAPSESPQ